MEYQVPQFIEVEDKIVGPLTFRQFVYLAGGVGLAVLAFSFLPIIVAVLASAASVGLALALSFYKINGKTFIEMLEAGFNYYLGHKFFLWKHEEPKTPVAPLTPPPTPPAQAVPAPGAPRLSRGKLSELAWSLDLPQGGGESPL
jgi:hypothetical protein